MRIRLKHPLLAALALLCLASAARADIKIKSRTSFGGQPGAETTVYIKGKRQRSETAGQMATVMQCDLRRTVQLNGTTKTYMVSPFDDGSAEQPQTAPPAGAREPSRRGGIVTTTMTMTDTGERKTMFGYTARRIKTSMVTESSPDACDKQKSRMESDGWYIDLAVEFDCYDKAATAGYSYQRPGGCRDEHRFKRVGAARMGYPVQVTTTMYDESGRATSSFTQEVLEISKAALDAALFDVPADYRLVKDASEMYSASAVMNAAQGGDDDDNDDAADQASTGGMPVNVAGGASQAQAAEGPKKPGVVRIGLVLPKATAAEGVDSNVLAEAVRNTTASYLAGPALEIVKLDARPPEQAEAEALKRECDYVLTMTVAHKKGGGGGFGMFKKIA
ncbi:MAG TPA: hypothetical protein VD968_03340, partial [Pyrinomonadaceae bacterium]|nr:hypothetical protein [Pyrinomonadaceae bacterium]